MINVGFILLWQGSIATIPSGWALCNGANGTPDLRNKFVIGAGSSFAVDQNGGASSHNHPFTGDGHTHAIQGGVNIPDGFGGLDPTDSAAGTGTTDNTANLPPYYALAFIMKV